MFELIDNKPIVMAVKWQAHPYYTHVGLFIGIHRQTQTVRLVFRDHVQDDIPMNSLTIVNIPQCLSQNEDLNHGILELNRKIRELKVNDDLSMYYRQSLFPIHTVAIKELEEALKSCQWGLQVISDIKYFLEYDTQTEDHGPSVCPGFPFPVLWKKAYALMAAGSATRFNHTTLN